MFDYTPAPFEFFDRFEPEPQMRPANESEYFMANSVLPLDAPVDYMEHLRGKMVREMWRKLSEVAKPGQEYYIRVGPVDMTPQPYPFSTIRFTIKATLIPIWKREPSLYTRVKPPVTAKTTVDAGADWLADYILRRILHK